MSSAPRPSEALRALAAEVPPAESSAQARARRERTIAHLRGLQARAAVRREMRTSWRNRLLVAAALLIPSGALGASLLPWSPIVRALHLEASPAPAPSSAPARPRPARRPRGNAPTTSIAGTAETPEVAPPPETPPDPPREALSAPAPDQGAAATPSVTSRTTNAPDDTSTLADENRLVQAALAAGRAGENARAVHLLTELLTRHPGSPLAQNAEVELFRALRRSGDEQSAARRALAYLSHYPNGMAANEARELARSALEPENERSF